MDNVWDSDKNHDFQSSINHKGPSENFWSISLSTAILWPMIRISPPTRIRLALQTTKTNNNQHHLIFGFCTSRINRIFSQGDPHRPLSFQEQGLKIASCVTQWSNFRSALNFTWSRCLSSRQKVSEVCLRWSSSGGSHCTNLLKQTKSGSTWVDWDCLLSLIPNDSVPRQQEGL